MPRPPVPLQIKLGRSIRRLRLEQGMSQEGLATAAGVHRTTMSLIERGEFDISLSTLQRLADGLGKEPSSLLLEAESEGRRAARKSPPEA